MSKCEKWVSACAVAPKRMTFCWMFYINRQLKRADRKQECVLSEQPIYIYTTIPFKCLVSIRFLNVFKRSLFCSLRLHVFDQTYSKNSNTVKYYNYLKSFYFNIFKNVIYWELSCLYASFRNKSIHFLLTYWPQMFQQFSHPPQ